MNVNKLLVVLAFSMFFSNGVAVAASDIAWDEISEIKTEPTQCYEAAFKIMNGIEGFDGFDGTYMGIALELCTGATDAPMVIGCVVKSTASIEEGGLGIPFAFAIGFCKQNG